jgi:hypothetical protein
MIFHHTVQSKSSPRVGCAAMIGVAHTEAGRADHAAFNFALFKRKRL